MKPRSQMARLLRYEIVQPGHEIRNIDRLAEREAESYPARGKRRICAHVRVVGIRRAAANLVYTDILKIAQHSRCIAIGRCLVKRRDSAQACQKAC